jgi:hypothetical protein
MGTQRDALGAVVVGTGFGCLTHVRALQAAGFVVQALVGRKPDRTRERATRFGIPHALVSLADALSLPGVDVVSVATPPHTHLDLVLEAVAAGRHVVCEKPFAADAAQARRMGRRQMLPVSSICWARSSDSPPVRRCSRAPCAPAPLGSRSWPRSSWTCRSSPTRGGAAGLVVRCRARGRVAGSARFPCHRPDPRHPG